MALKVLYDISITYLERGGAKNHIANPEPTMSNPFAEKSNFTVEIINVEAVKQGI